MTATELLSPTLNLYRALEARDLDAAALFRRAGCDPDHLKAPDVRVTNRVVRRLYELAEEETGDPCFGLEVGAQVRGVALHALGYSWLASATLGDALGRLLRYTRVLSHAWRPEMQEEPRGVRVSIHWDRASFQPPARHDAILAGFVKLSRITYGDTFAPLEVTVDRDRPSCAQRFEEWFRAPIVWATSPPSLLLRREDLARSLATANPSVAMATERLAAEYLARIDRDDVRARVRRHILGLLPSGAPNQRETARALGLSSRTLHRRLADAGTSFGELLDEMRRELSHEYLRRSDYAVSEVAYLLGFAETSSFNRAFRRWTGQAPSEFRRAPAGAAPGVNAG